MGDLLLATKTQLIDRLHNALRAVNRVGGVDLHRLAVIDHHRVTRDGDERRLLLSGIDAGEDNRVGAVRIFARATVSAEQQDVKRLTSDVGVVQNHPDALAEHSVAGEVSRYSNEPGADPNHAHEQHRQQAAQHAALDHAATTALAGTFGIPANVLTAIDAAARSG